MDEWVKKMWYKHNEKGNPAICDNQEPWGHYAKWNKPGGEGKIPYDLVTEQTGGGGSQYIISILIRIALNL